MKQYIDKMQDTWTMTHKQLIVIISLAVVIICLEFGGAVNNFIAHVEAYGEVSYLQVDTCDLECELEVRALELYEANRGMDLERYRIQALQENLRVSSFVDYDELEQKYGY